MVRKSDTAESIELVATSVIPTLYFYISRMPSHFNFAAVVCQSGLPILYRKALSDFILKLLVQTGVHLNR